MHMVVILIGIFQCISKLRSQNMTALPKRQHGQYDAQWAPASPHPVPVFNSGLAESQSRGSQSVRNLDIQHCVQSRCSLGRQARGHSAVSLSHLYISLYDLMPTKVKLTLRVGKGRAEGYLWHLKESCIVTLCWAVGHTSDCKGQGYGLV